MKLQRQRGWPLLAWVWPALADTFAAASHALHESGEAIMTAACADHLRLAQGVLEMIEQEAPARFAEEMRAVAVALASDALPGQADYQRATLSRALILLPEHLRGLVANEHYVDHRNHAPKSLLPLFNELRVSRGQSALPPSAWFFPSLDAPLPSCVPGARVDTSTEQRRAAVAALHARLQQPMLGWLRGQASPLQLAAMREMLEAIGAQSLSMAGRRLWWIAASVLEGVERGALQAQIGEVRRLIGKVDRSILRWLESGEQSLAEADATELSRQLLYLVEQARPQTPRLRQLRQIYRLGDGLPDQGAGPSHAELTVRGSLEPTAFSEATQVAKQELQRAKDALELLFQRRAAEALPFDNALRALGGLGSALDRLGLSRQELDERQRILEEIAVQSRDPDPSSLLDVAAVLLQTEAMLDQPAERPRSEEERLVTVIMQESAIDAAAAAGSLAAFTEAGGDPARLEQLPTLMRRIASAMQMLSAPRPAALAMAIGRFVETELLCGQANPSGDSIERLADGLTALNRYAELACDYQLGFERVLEVGERSLAELGYASMAPHSDEDGDMDQLPVRPVQRASSAISEDPDTMADNAQRPGARESADGAAEWQGSVLSDLRDEVEFPIDTDRLNRRKPAQEGDDGLDAEVRAIFLQELQDAIERLHATLPAWQATPAQADIAAPLLRTFQDLRATSLLLGARELAEWAGELTDLLLGVLEQRVPYASVHELIGQAVEAVPSLQRAFSAEGKPFTAARTLIDSAGRLAVRETDPGHGQDETAASSVPSGMVSVEAAHTDSAAETNHAAGESAAGSRANSSEVVASDAQVLAAFSNDAMPSKEPLLPEVDEVLLDILRSEVAQHLSTIRSSMRRPSQSESREANDLLRAVHTLHGVVAMVDIAPLIPLLSSLEGLLKQRKTLPSGAEDLLGDVADAVDQTVAQLGVEQPRLPPIDDLMARLIGLTEAPNHPGPPTQVHENVQQTVESPPVGRGAAGSEDHQIVGAASAENFFSEEEKKDPPGIEPSKPAGQSFGNEVASGTAGSMAAARSSAMSRTADASFTSAPSLSVRRDDYRNGEVEPIKRTVGQDSTARRPDHPPDDRSATGQGQGPKQDLSGGLPVDGPGAGGAALPSDAGAPLTPVDPDLLETFLEEAAEILDHADGELAAWRAEPSERARIASLQRDLHTLKGGARIVGLSPIGDLCHAMETVLDRFANQALPLDPLDLEPIAALESGFDELYAMLRRIGHTSSIERPTATITRLLALSGDGAGALGDRLAATGGQASDVLPAVAFSSAGPRLAGAISSAEELPAPAEHLRVRADLVDDLVDLAGEAAIYQSRLDQQIGGYRFNLAELEQTVSRLRAQLRALEIETEAQIIARYQREHRDAGLASFDPLELDRYSQLQQYSRALAESVSDLVSLQSALNELTRQAEDLLAQQSRLGSRFRESLRHTRMLPFDTLMPNLRRTLRQAASDLGKQARLQVDGAHGEMDRHLLDQLKAPFEHMLRNAVAHGIEMPTERIAAGKAAEGQVRIEVARESTEVVIRVSDDGRGLDREAIRSRAFEQGLLTKEAPVADAQWLPLITQPGFSTAGELTQLAGRGLGMDVVASQIRRLGGSLSVESTPGAGTTFIMRLPFTLEVVQAMVVRLGESPFAVPMTSVQGLAWIASADLAALVAESSPYSGHAGESYPVFDLAELLGLPPSCTADEVPLLLVHSGDLRAAISVDALLGSWEIVVKPVGPQISLVPGILGATIMGDGAVLVILDLPSLVRHGDSRRESRAAQVAAAVDPRSSAAGAGGRPMVMVVDDSITMRKVTSRVLERHGFDVMTARDGIEALEKLATTIPDLMLLDVEMPRMDGYQLAGHLRSDVRWAAMPVIMITSRSGEKHRLRALDLGIGDYLGKPYQESELVARIEHLLGLSPRETSYD